MKLKRTKIVATISPKVSSTEMLTDFILAGVNVFRLNTAHLDLTHARELVAKIRKIAPHVAILIDTKGPEVRTCQVEPTFAVKTGDVIEVTPNNEGIAGKSFQVNYPNFAQDVKEGQIILLDDGAVELQILSIQDDRIKVCVLNDGEIKNRKTVNVPGAIMHLPPVSDRDKEFIQFAIDMDLDFIAHSFVRSRDDVMAVQEILDQAKSKIKIIAKIENRQGVNNLSGILTVAYGVMVARGDLGVEIPAEEVPVIQKKMIVECMRRRRPVITATQMLQSMITNPRPTRAEVSDVANAVLDGSDAVMLSGETAQGDYPLESVQMMAKIIRQAELATAENARYYMKLLREDFINEQSPTHSYIVRGAVEAGESLPIAAIICHTMRGASALKASCFRGPKPIFAITPKERVMRELALSYGVYAFTSPQSSLENLDLDSAKILLEEGWLEPDDLVVSLGIIPHSGKSANYLAITKMKDLVASTLSQKFDEH